MQLQVVNEEQDFREEADLTTGIRRFNAVDDTGRVMFEGVEFSNGAVAICGELSGVAAFHPNIKSLASLGAATILWIGDATNAEQSQQRADAFETGKTEGQWQAEREVGELERDIEAMVNFVCEAVEGNPEEDIGDDYVSYVNNEVSGLCRTIEKREARIRVMQHDLNSMREQVERFIKRNGELLSHLRVGRDILAELTGPNQSLAVYLEARRQGEKFVKDCPR